jgi:hypothetical protein
MGHDRKEHRRGQECSDDHATGQVGDFRSALSHVRGLRLTRAGATVGRVEASRHRFHRRPGAGVVGGVDNQGAVDHVHAAGKTERAGPVGA